jgi:ADP-ribose pyrophosphatase YjhB (NUDIX family)
LLLFVTQKLGNIWLLVRNFKILKMFSFSLFRQLEETRNRGIWLPGGFVECGDSHHKTAIKETLEEGGIAINLMGILCVQSSIGKTSARQRVIYYAEPADLSQLPKSVPDDESLRGLW